MPDSRLRGLERSWKQTGSLADGQAYAAALLRARATPLTFEEVARRLFPAPLEGRLGACEVASLDSPLFSSALRLVCVVQRFWQYDVFNMFFCERDGVPYLLEPKDPMRVVRGGTRRLDGLLGTLWPQESELEPLSWVRWLGASRASYGLLGDRDAPPPGWDGVPGLVRLDLGPLLQPQLWSMMRDADYVALADALQILYVIANHHGCGSSGPARPTISLEAVDVSDLVPEGSLPDAPSGVVREGQGYALTALAVKREDIDGWTGQRARLSRCTLTVQPGSWSFVDETLTEEQEFGAALT